MHKRILIIGESGRGKTTLARKLSEKTGITHHQTDDYFWKTKYSEPYPREEALERIKAEYEKDSWIIEGTTFWLLEPGLEKADTIVFLCFNNLLSQWFSIVKRAIKEKRENLKELFGLLKHVTYKRYRWGYKKGSVTHRQIIEPYKEKVVVLDSFNKIDKFIQNI